MDTKLYLLKTFNEFIVLIFLKSNKKSKEKNKYNKKIYTYIFIYIIENPKQGLFETIFKVFWESKCNSWIEVYSKYGNLMYLEI